MREIRKPLILVAALRLAKQEPWFFVFLQNLLENSPAVTAFLVKNLSSAACYCPEISWMENRRTANSELVDPPNALSIAIPISLNS